MGMALAFRCEFHVGRSTKEEEEEEQHVTLV
jgi:hypothetical protein